MEARTVYFEKRGAENTEETLRLARERAEELGVRNVVVASYTGFTGVKAVEVLEGYNVVVVAGVVGFREPQQDRLEPEAREAIEARGGRIVRAAHAFGTLGRAVKARFGAIQVDEIIAHVLRLFSQGVKVGCEVACMAVDAGLIRTDEECIAIGGSGRGADTAIVLRPSNTHTFFDTRILEIICKPRG
ncbi:MAG: hypothetical protein JSV18_00235 [Candidatus Bathyarchaeota archaeon]|nr:MAG: hypothetical protein JSV18_00235 [Candidatus Bathyarchaeota archaeon]